MAFDRVAAVKQLWLCLAQVGLMARVCTLKRIFGERGMEKTMNCMENSLKTTFKLEPRRIGVKSRVWPARRTGLA